MTLMYSQKKFASLFKKRHSEPPFEFDFSIFKKSQFSDGEVIFGQTPLVLDQFGYVLSISEL